MDYHHAGGINCTELLPYHVTLHWCGNFDVIFRRFVVRYRITGKYSKRTFLDWLVAIIPIFGWLPKYEIKAWLIVRPLPSNNGSESPDFHALSSAHHQQKRGLDKTPTTQLQIALTIYQT